jgi:hypothetical protein
MFNTIKQSRCQRYCGGLHPLLVGFSGGEIADAIGVGDHGGTVFPLCFRATESVRRQTTFASIETVRKLRRRTEVLLAKKALASF